jgi:hypothetical protein
VSYQEESEKFLPAFFVDVVELGQEFKSGELPLHMTYFPPVQAPFDIQTATKLRRLINPLKPFTATVGESDLFGPDRDIHVKLIEHSPQLLAVHRRLVATFQDLPHDPKYLMPYTPHIAMDVHDTRIKTGDTIEMGGLSIVEKLPYKGVWQVLAKIGLKGEAEITV